jgi:transposase
VYCRRVAFYCAFLGTKGLNAKDIHKEIFPVYVGKCLSRKAVHNWVEKFSQRRSKVADDARPGLPVEIATEATAQRVEDFIRGDRRITIDSVASALGCSYDLAYSIMHDLLKFRKVCALWVPRKLKDRSKMNRIISYCIHMKVKIRLTRLLLGRIMGASLPTQIKVCFNAMETSQFTFNQKAPSLRLRHQLGRLCLPCFEILREYCSPFSEAL